MWKYSAKNDNQNISLHDCRIINVSLDKKDLLLSFDENGFWILENNRYNKFGKILRTDKSEVRILNCDADFSSIYIFKVYSIFGKPILTRRIELTLQEFASRINSGEWQFEFIDEYYAWQSVVFNGWVWFKKKPYHMECQLQISYNDMIYSWNEICENKPW